MAFLVVGRVGRPLHPFSTSLVASRYQEALDLRRKNQGIAPHRLKERSDTESILRKEQHFLLSVPYRKSPLPVHVLNAIGAIFFVELQDDFGITLRREPMSFACQLLAQLNVI